MKRPDDGCYVTVSAAMLDGHLERYASNEVWRVAATNEHGTCLTNRRGESVLLPSHEGRDYACAPVEMVRALWGASAAAGMACGTCARARLVALLEGVDV